MKTTIDIPDDLANEVKRLAERSGRDAGEELLRLVYLAIVLEGLPFVELEHLARRLSVVRAMGNKVAQDTTDRPGNSLAISTDPSTGLPVINSPPDAPIRSMTVEQFQAVIQEAELEGELERTRLTFRH